MRAQFGHDPSSVNLDGFFGGPELEGDLLVRHAGNVQSEDLVFAGSERRQALPEFFQLRLILFCPAVGFDLHFLISTLCVGDKIPIFSKNEDGKRSDKEINNTILTQISKHMAQFGAGEKAFIYIADSAPVTLKNLKELSDGQPFITRLPATYAECGRAISEVVRANQ